MWPEGAIVCDNWHEEVAADAAATLSHLQGLQLSLMTPFSVLFLPNLRLKCVFNNGVSPHVCKIE